MFEGNFESIASASTSDDIENSEEEERSFLENAITVVLEKNWGSIGLKIKVSIDLGLLYSFFMITYFLFRLLRHLISITQSISVYFILFE